MRAKEGLSTAFYFSTSLVVALVTWEVLVRLLNVPIYLIPPPSQVVTTLVAQWGQLWKHTLLTANETLVGFAAAIIVGVPLAVMIVYSSILEKFVYPLLVAAQVIPKVAIAPLFVIWFGFGFMPKIIVAFLIAFFPIVIDTAVGLRNTDPDMLYLARSMGGNMLNTFLKIRLPNALPNIFGGMKVAITLAVVGAVVGEFVGSSDGLGYILLVATGNLNTPLVFASILLMSLLGIVLFALMEGAERLLLPWRPTERLEQAARGTS